MSKKIYFASDFHLGTPSFEKSRFREDKIVRWLDSIKREASEIYLLGDIFDFWFEYQAVVPKGYIRFLGKIAELTDAGIKVYFFKGNHDMWMQTYFEKELNVITISNELIFTRENKSFYLHHGDGLGAGDFNYKCLKYAFRSKLCQWIFARLHPNLGVGIAQKWSKSSRIANDRKEEFKGKEKEWLYQYCIEKLQSTHYDYFIFGHRHLPLDIALPSNSQYVNLGEWLNHCTYAVFDGEKLTLEKFTE